jgi:hypothetical protein
MDNLGYRFSAMSQGDGNAQQHYKAYDGNQR